MGAHRKCEKELYTLSCFPPLSQQTQPSLPHESEEGSFSLETSLQTQHSLALFLSSLFLIFSSCFNWKSLREQKKSIGGRASFVDDLVPYLLSGPEKCRIFPHPKIALFLGMRVLSFHSSLVVCWLVYRLR
jgi:hypothetical protein